MNAKTYQQVSAKVIDGIGGVKSEGHLEAMVMGQQVGVEDVVPMVPSEIVEEEQVEVSEDLGETSKGDDDQIEMDLERIILMIED
jgi:hypothetical protein